jgi:MoaA/NifB/PqqE/SkfB family radical SAM enzyme
MSMERFRTIIRRLKAYGAYIGFISGGEPTLVDHLDKILVEAKRTFLLSTTLVTGLYNETGTIERIGRLAMEHDIHIQTSLDGLGDLGDYLRGSRGFSETVLRHMQTLAEARNGSKSLLYANIVLNDLNLDQIPELIQRARDIGWKTTIGMYHNLTDTTRQDHSLRLTPGTRLDRVIDYLTGNADILNLDAFIEGIPRFVKSGRSPHCAFVDAPVLATRTTVMEDGDLHLCTGPAIGNLLEQSMDKIFNGQAYLNRLRAYRSCPGCWTTCYTQRLLLVRPRSLKALRDNIHSLFQLKEVRSPSRL